MTTTELLAELTRQGVQLQVDGEELKVRAPKGVLTPSLRAALAQEKPGILERLRAQLASEPEARPPLVPALNDRYLPFPLTDMQQAYWLGRTAAFELGRIACQVYMEIEHAGLDVSKLAQAWRRLVDHHDMLRAVVRSDGQQQILERVPPYEIDCLDLTHVDAGTTAARLEQIRAGMSHRVTELEEWPLFEIRATRFGEDRVRVHFRMELIIADAWSVMFLMRDWFQLYLVPDLPLEPLQVSFRDYVLAETQLQDSDAYKRAERYWMERIPSLPAAPDLPLAQSPSAIAQPRFVRRTSELDAVRWQRLKARAARAGVTPSGVLCTAFTDVLATWSKSPHFTLNLTFFNRPPIHPQLQQVIGDYTSTILLEVDGTAATFEARARRLQKQLAQDLEASVYSGVRVLRELNRTRRGLTTAAAPIVFTSGLSLRTGDDSPADALGALVYGISQTPQVWLDHQTFERGGQLFTSWDAVDALFPPGVLDNMFTAYERLLVRLADDDGSWGEGRRHIVPCEQLRERDAINATASPVPEGLLQTGFLERAVQQPDQPAVASGAVVLSYGELLRRANYLGYRLRESGARPNTLIAVVMEKGWEQVVAVLGILQSGAAYLPIDPDVPPERVAYLLENGEVALVVTTTAADARLSWPEHITRFRVDDAAIARGEEPILGPVQQQADLAYVIYTSGSTGRPKGVVIDHRGAVNTIVDVNNRFNVTRDDRVLALSALSFDLSVYDIFGVLGAGGTVVMTDPSQARNPAHWVELLQRHGVTIWNTVPALLEMLVEYATGQPHLIPPSLRLAMMSGDWIPVTLPDRLRTLTQNVQIVSLGGATEASIWSITYPIGSVDPAWKSIPYGRPMVNQQFHVLNDALEPCPVWVPGQLFIGGIGLALGYWRDEAQTNASFIVSPHTGERLYRTGDWGRYLPDGNIEFLGREDFQVKVGGHRIELGEIESALSQHPSVRAGVVVAAGDPKGNRRLVAYIVPEVAAAAAQHTTSRPQPDVALQQLDAATDLLLDPIAREEFKLRQPGLRRDSQPIALIHLDRGTLDEDAIAAYAQRRSYRTFVDEEIPLAHLSDLLGCLMRIDIDGVSVPKAQYGSAGGLYPVQAYLYIKPKRVQGLEGGIYYYHPHDHCLVLLAADAHINADMHAPVNRDVFERSAFSIFLVGRIGAIEPLYGDLGRQFASVEAGLMAQLLEMSAPTHLIGLCQMGGLDFQRVQPFFALGDSDILLHSLVGGGIDPQQRTVAGLRLEAAKTLTAQSTVPRTSSLEAPLVAEVRRFLRTTVPEYMVPSSFVLLNELPLTANGKADRKALLAREGSERSSAAYVAPASALEQTIVGVVQDVLRVERVGVHDNFFELGATSVELVQAHRKLQAALEQELPIVDMFKYPTVSALARYLSQSNDDTRALEDSHARGRSRREAMRTRSRGRARTANGSEFEG